MIFINYLLALVLFALIYLGVRLVRFWLKKEPIWPLLSWNLLINGIAYSVLTLVLLGVLHLVFKKINTINLLWLDAFIYIFVALIKPDQIFNQIKNKEKYHLKKNHLLGASLFIFILLECFAFNASAYSSNKETFTYQNYVSEGVTTDGEIEGNKIILKNKQCIYIDTNQKNYDSIYLLFNTEDMNLYVNYQNTTPIIAPSDIPNGKYLTISSDFNGEISLVVSGTTYRIRKEISNGYTYYYLPFIYNNSGTLELYWTKWRRSNMSPDVLYLYAGGSLINPAQTTTTGFDVDTNLDEIGVLILDDMPDGSSPIAKADYIDASAINDTISFANTLQTTINSINSIDRTMKQNIKIIDIPYSPSNISDESGTITMDGTWGYDSQTGFFKLRNYNVRFQNFITSNLDDILKYFETNISTINTNATRYIKDSKLYHSDYFRPKFVYDSFTKIFPLEQMDYGESIMLKSNDKFEFTFVMSRNIVSKFLFQFNYIYKQSMEDYPNMLAVARNNEEVLYNSQYLNYIRTGYNYDLKTKERNEVASGVGLGLSITSLIASIALTASGYGTPIGATGIIGSLGGIAGSVVGLAKAVAQAEDNIQRKLQETQRESVSVLNADDSDLLYAYTGNKAKLCVYNVSSQMEEILDDMFYYVGYLCNETKIPSFITRYWFNFIQAEIELKDTGRNLTQEVIENLKQRFSNGITILHKHSVGGANTWNFDLDKENWEVSLL